MGMYPPPPLKNIKEACPWPDLVIFHSFFFFCFVQFRCSFESILSDGRKHFTRNGKMVVKISIFTNRDHLQTKGGFPIKFKTEIRNLKIGG